MRVPVVLEEQVLALVAPEVFARGMAYALDGRVLSATWDEDRGLLTGRVRGSGREVYTQYIHLDPEGEPLGGVCSCPVRVSCKHVAAVLLQAAVLPQRSGVPGAAPSGPVRQPAWAQVLDSVLTAPQRRVSRPRAPLALLLDVQVDPADSRQEQPRAHRLAVRPAVRSDRGRWVRTGAGWSEVVGPYSAAGFVPEHREGFVALHRLIETTAAARSWGTTAAWLFLDRGPGVAVWAMLTELRRVGVEILAAQAPGDPVLVHDEPAQVRLDLHEDEAGLRVLPGVVVGGERLDPERLGLIGLPSPAGVYWWTEAPRTLSLARFTAPLDRRAEPLLTMPGSLRVPAPTAAEFWGTYIPRLSGVLPLTSTDGTAHPPEPATPGLRLDVTVRERHTVAIAWSWAYRSTGSTPPEPVPLGPIDRLGQPWRSSDGETRLLAAAATAVAGALGEPPPGVPPIEGTPAAASAERLRAALLQPLRTHASGHPGLTDWDTVTLVDRVLPALRDVDGVEVRIVGDLPDYREATTSARVVVGTGSDDELGLGADRDWFELSVTIEVDDRQVPLEAVLRAFAAGEDRVLLDDGLWLRIDTPQLAALRALVEEARALGDSRRGPLTVGRFDVGAWDELVALGVIVQQAKAWTQAVGRLAELSA
ncbi:MAG: hypothetical protein L6311_01235, partial [Cellulomonas sp.]|nr:hypothetical protein [Cellulomonas sp.]